MAWRCCTMNSRTMRIWDESSHIPNLFLHHVQIPFPTSNITFHHDT
jgi:hypothetical protein